MTDRETMLERLRSANPLPDDDLVDAEEFGLFVSYFAERKDAMQPTPTRTPTRSSETLQHPWYRRPIVAFGAAVAVTILLVAPLLMLRSSPTDELVDDPIASTTTTRPMIRAIRSMRAWAESAPAISSKSKCSRGSVDLP